MKAHRGGQRCSSTLSLTSVIDGVAGQRHAPAALPPGKVNTFIGVYSAVLHICCVISKRSKRL
jgi:hypothetical protein